MKTMTEFAIKILNPHQSWPFLARDCIKINNLEMVIFTLSLILYLMAVPPILPIIGFTLFLWAIAIRKMHDFSNVNVDFELDPQEIEMAIKEDLFES